jgi:hypothetical protein
MTIGMPATVQPHRITTESHPHRVAGHYVTFGELAADAASYRYAMVWQDDAGQRRIVQTLPQHHIHARPRRYPEPVERLDAVARRRSATESHTASG